VTTYNITLTPGVDTDQSVDCQTQLSAVPSGTVGSPNIINMPAGRYRIDRGLSLYQKSHIRWTCLAGVSTYPSVPSTSQAFIAYTDITGLDTGQASGSPLKSQRRHFQMTGCTDVIGSFLRIEGPNDLAVDFGTYSDNLSNEHGFAIANDNIANSGCVDCGWEDCSTYRVFGDAYYVGGPNPPSPAIYFSNENIHLTRVLGEFNGRQGMGIVNVVGFVVTDADVRKSGRSGYDAEPNGKYNRTWNVDLVRMTMHAKFGAFAIQGSGGGVGAGIPVRNKNYYLEDCVSLSTTNNSTFYGDIAHQGSPGESGYLVILGFTNVTQSGSTNGITARCWQDVTIDDATVTTGAHTPISTAVIASCYGTLTLTNSDFSLYTGQGYDQLLTVPTSLGDIPTSVVHYGNIWNAGQNDGVGPPAGNQASIAQTLPMVTQSAAATGGSTPVFPDVELPRVNGKFAGAPFGLFQFANPGQQQEAVVSQTLPMLTQSAVALNGPAVSGAITQTLPMPTQAAAAVNAPAVEAVVTQTLPMLTQSVTAKVGESTTVDTFDTSPAQAVWIVRLVPGTWTAGTVESRRVSLQNA
jgi:hypothetical protein